MQKKQMTLEDKIFLAKERWNSSFQEIAFLLDMDSSEVGQIYHQESVKRKKLHTMTLNSKVEECMVLPTRITNLLKRHRIYTIKQLIKLQNDVDVAWAGAGKMTMNQILEAADRARKEVDAR